MGVVPGKRAVDKDDQRRTGQDGQSVVEGRNQRQRQKGIWQKGCQLLGTAPGEYNVSVVYSKNARIRSDERLAELLSELSHETWDVVCFSETRATSADVILLGGHRLISHRGVNYGGVAVLVNVQWADSICCSMHFGERVLALQMMIGTFF